MKNESADEVLEASYLVVEIEAKAIEATQMLR